MTPLRLKNLQSNASANPLDAAQRLDLCLVIPAYNEENAAGPTVERVRAVLGNLPVSYEIIVVDDGSKDGTRLAAERTGARVLVSPVNRGYG